MTSTPEQVLRYARGLRAEIVHDPDAEPPYADDDAVRIVVLHRRYADPAHGACGRDPDEVRQWERENAHAWFTIPLFLYDHSGTVYRVGENNPFQCPWDSGRVGIVALRRGAWGDCHPTDTELAARAQTVAAIYTAWANGESYGCVLRDGSGEELSSCWGFIGRDAVIAGASAAAQGHLNAARSE
jgi:hypothetical protein